MRALFAVTLVMWLGAACVGVADLSETSSATNPLPSSGLGPPGGTGPSQPQADGGASGPGEADAGSTGAPLDAGTATPPDAGSPPLPCGTLATRVRTVTVSVAPASVDVGSGYGWSNNRPVHFAPLPGGAAKVAWSSTDGHVHVTPLDTSLARAGPDVVVDGVSVRGFVAHADGAVALLVVRGTSMVFVRLKPDGTLDVEKVLVGDTPNEVTPGSRWVDGWGHEGRLVWTGASYVAYFGHTKYWGAQGKHQGDLLVTLSPTGQPASGPGWDWGCSHSLDLRLAWDGTRAAPVCLSDCYRVKGVLLDDNDVLSDEPSGNCAGSSDAQLGGVTALPGGGFAVTFASKEGRSSRDVGFVRLAANGSKSATTWVVASPAEDATPALARYGPDRLLLAWKEGGAGKMAVVSWDGSVLEGPVALSADWADRDDFAAWDQGSVGWAAGAGGALTVSTVRWCTP